MATFKVVAGDFGQDVTGDVCTGKKYRRSAQGLTMPILGQPYSTEHIAPGQIEALDVATEEALKRMGGSIGWGMAGAFVAGPIGALAGALKGGRKTEITFICKFKDGRSFLGQCDAQTFTLIQAARFPLPHAAVSKVSKPHPLMGLLTLVCILVSFVWILHLVFDKPDNNPSSTSTSNFNQSAVSFVTYLLNDDMNAMLIRDQKSAIWPKVEDLLGWLELNWSLPATSYEDDYDANEISSDNKYKGQRLLVFGVISSVAKDFSGQSYATLRGSGIMGIRAELSPTGTISASAFRKGQHVNLVCNGTGQVMTIATLDNCETLDNYIDRLRPSLHDRVEGFLGGGKTMGKAEAAPIIEMYVVGLHLPANSPCLGGKRATCEAEMKAVLKDKTQGEAIRAQSQSMLAAHNTQ